MTSPEENLFLSQTTFSSRVRVEQFRMFPLGNHNSWYFPWPKTQRKNSRTSHNSNKKGKRKKTSSQDKHVRASTMFIQSKRITGKNDKEMKCYEGRRLAEREREGIGRKKKQSSLLLIVRYSSLSRKLNPKKILINDANLSVLRNT